MKRLLLALALASAAPAFAQHHHAAPSAESAEKLHPLTGVVVDVMADKQALLVKHDEIPGVMRAMTMMFRVEPEVLAKARKGDALKAKMGRDAERRWILREVEFVTPSKKS